MLPCVGAAVGLWYRFNHGLWRYSSVDWSYGKWTQCAEPAGANGQSLVPSQQSPGLPSTVWLSYSVAHSDLLRPQRPDRHSWPSTSQNSISVSTGRKNAETGGVGFMLAFHQLFLFLMWSVECQNYQVFLSLCSQHNNISSLSPFLTNLTDLRWLILDHNQLQKLDQAALQNQTQLCNFFANHNHLKSVPSNLPAGIMQLRLAHNQISSISPGAFQNLHNLTMLLLQGNRLQTITGGDLKGWVMRHFLSLYIVLTLAWRVKSSVHKYLLCFIFHWLTAGVLLIVCEDLNKATC